MRVVLSDSVDMQELGDWLELNVGPVWLRATTATPTVPKGTPFSKGRLWVIEYDFDTRKYCLLLDGRRLKPRSSFIRTELLLKFS